MTMGDRIVVMKDGVIMQNDTPQMLYNHPQNMFVAGFIGSPQMNFINCKIIRKNDAFFACFYSYEMKLPKRMDEPLSLYTDKEVILGIRPEDIHTEKFYFNKDSNNIVEIYVDIAEMTGSDYYLYGSIGDQKLIANISPNSQIKSDTNCQLAIDTNKIHIFDKVSEKLICD
jgi:multiple sugar transport system ATP-binding protein